MEIFWKSNTIAERFEFVEELGKGGIGTVILARDKTLDKHVAIKILNANLSNEESIRFQQEGILAGRLNHENLVSVFDFGVTETGVPYLIMEYLQGFSLGDMITADGALETLFAIRIFQQICRGMLSSHKAGVIHRDLKPANVFMVQNDDDTFSAKIVDFGLARLLDENARLTAAGAAIGSPLYMSPEQGQGLPGDERSDIYSMGCLMYRALTGRTPFEGETAMLTVMMHQQAKPEKLSVVADKTFPRELEAIVAKCLEKKPQDRFQTFGELQTELEKLETEIVRLEREEALESVSRSGLQKALTSVTDFATPLASVSNKKVPFMVLVVVAVGVAAAFGIYALVPQFIKPAEVEDKKTEPVAFADDIIALSKLSIVDKHGRVSCKGYPENTDSDLKVLKDIKRLEELNLSNSSCTGAGLKFLPNTVIIKLNLDSSAASNEGVQEIAKVKGLRTLLLKDCDDLEDSSFAHLADIETLQELSFSGKKLTENSFKYLETYPQLIHVGLDEFHVTKDGIDKILKVPKLRSIMFEDSEIDSAVLTRLQKHKNGFERIGFADMTLTPDMVATMKKVKTKYITLHDVKMTSAVFSQIKHDDRYAWAECKVDGKHLADRDQRR